ncbi:hypothetical protein RBH29_17645 [Herbivorax sp. ANBcel31]|uniref:hypothetical protein n=1 Tax=Herbivorax sp. ANBcel31 TaxID=3069754 RepID=UPI0027AFA8B9|nr:hypothetical protein [Herbivorax sp. ANBcel31]MDQ2088251.1 hypothetical protein [Herbivorax sp. ANBcel31]
MDLILDILLRKEDFKKLNIIELFNEWGGEKIPHEPRKYKFNSKLVFHLNIDINYYSNIIQDDIDVEEFISLSLEGNSLLELEIMVNKGKKHLPESELIIFLNELYNSLEEVCIVKLLNEERIDEKHIINDTKKAIDVFINSLDWKSPKGIVITKRLDKSIDMIEECQF